MPNGFYYLATPYSAHPEGFTQAYLDASRQLAITLAAGIKVFCPIVHSHYVHLEPELEKYNDSHDFWLGLDKVFLDAAIGLIVVKMPGWEQSRGIKWEIDYMKQLGKPIYYVDFLAIPELKE